MLRRAALLLSLTVGTAFAGPPATDEATGDTTIIAPASEPNSEPPVQPEKSSTAKVIEYLDAIEEQEAHSSAYDQTLSEMFYGLAKALQDQGNHQEAVDAFKHSMHVNRVNNGIYSVTQEPMLRGMIESQGAMAKLDRVAVHYSQLLWLYEKSYGSSSPELIPVLEEASNWHREMYLNWQSRDTVGHLILSISLAGSAVDIATQHFGSTHIQLVNLLRDMAESSYYLATHYSKYRSLEPRDNSSFNTSTSSSFGRHPALNSATNSVANEERLWIDSYNSGRNAYQRIVAILNDNDATPQDRATALVELGDWFMLFKRRDPALDSYAKAWHALNDAGEEKYLKRLLGKPVMLPNFTDENNTGPRPQRLAKVKMDVSKGGRARSIEVIETYPPEDDHVARVARKILRAAHFRARFENGEPVATEDYELNLYISD